MAGVTIVIKVSDKEIKLSVNEAENLYEQLGKLFGQRKNNPIPQIPIGPNHPPYPDYPIVSD